MTDPAPAPGPEAATLSIADDPEPWAAAGFTVDDDGVCRVGHLSLVLAGHDAGQGVIGWGLRGLPEGAAADLDGFPTRATDQGPAAPASHPNTATVVDHIVLLTDDLDRTVTAAAGVGLTPRRWRDHALPDGTAARQAFFRVGEIVLEVVAPRQRPAVPRPGVRSFGLAVTVADLSAATALLGEAASEARPAVQAGRAIATIRGRALGLGTPLALMSPRPAPAPAGGGR